METKYIVMTNGTWGGAPTLKQAAREAFEAGASKRDKAAAWECTGTKEELAEVCCDGAGYFCHPQSVTPKRLFGPVTKDARTIGALLK